MRLKPRRLGNLGSKRMIMAVAIVFAILFPTTVFAGGAQEEDVDPDRPFEGETISFASMNDPFAYVIEEMLPQFEDETGISVEMDIIPYSGLREQTITDLVGGTAEFDVITMDIVWMGEWAEAGFITQLDDYIQDDEIDMDDFLPGALEGLTYWNGDSFGMPIGLYHFLMSYRTDILEELDRDPPVTFDELIEFGEAASELEDDLFGIAAPYQRGAPIVHYSLAYLSAAGGGVLDSEDGGPIISNETAVQVYEYYQEFLDIGASGMSSYDWFDSSEAYEQGRAASFGGWNVVFPGFEDSDQSDVVGNTEYTPLPVISSDDEPIVPVGGWSLVINDDSQKKDAAWELIKWLVSEDVQLEYAENNGTPVRFDTLENENLQERFPWYEVVLEAESSGIADARYRPRIPEWPDMEEELGLLLNQAMLGEESIPDALDSAQSQIESILAE